ncbi:MAG: pilus assembly protein [Actinobacteria bacterium]|jgi:Flp pilus assembly protein TadG|nr:pilus assembly protein [Actinomycetota bacterium]
MTRWDACQYESGSMVVELVVLVPLLVLVALLCVALGRFEMAREQVIGAARSGAEAASVMATASQAEAAASAAAVPSVFGQARACSHLGVRTNVSRYEPGGSVAVTVACQVSLSDLFVPGVPGVVRVEATEDAPIDPYRVVG